MNKLIGLYKRCRLSGCRFLVVLLRHILFRLRGKNIVPHHKASFKGAKNIETKGVLRVGMSYVSFMHRSDITFLNIKGKLIFEGDYSIGRGCRIAIKENAEIKIGKGGYVNANTVFKIEHGLKIGSECAISWECQFLDEDFHQIDYPEYTEKAKEIEIGDHVWIGCYTTIYKGTKIPNNCVIAANSVVRGVFTEENVLIAGNPARVIKRNVNWD